MAGHLSTMRRIGDRISRITELDCQFTRYADRTRDEVNVFYNRLADTGADIGGGRYPVRRSVAFRGPEHPIEGPWANGMLLSEPLPEPSMFPTRPNSQHPSIYETAYRRQVLASEHAQWQLQQRRAADQQQQPQRHRRMTTPSARAANYETNSARQHVPRPRRGWDNEAWQRPRVVPNANSDATLRDPYPSMGHTLRPFRSDHSDTESDQEYVTSTGDSIPRRRDDQRKRRGELPRDYLERLHMRQAGVTRRLTVANP